LVRRSSDGLPTAMGAFFTGVGSPRRQWAAAVLSHEAIDSMRTDDFLSRV